MDSKEFLKRLLTTTVGMEETAVAELYNSEGQLKDDAINTVLQKDKDRMKVIKDGHVTELTAAQEKGYNRAKAEALTKFEDEAKAEFNITSDKKGHELIKEIVKAQATSSGTPLKEDEIVKHPLYLKLQDDSQKALNTQKSDYEQKLKDKDSEVKKKEDGSFVKKTFQKMFKELNPVIPEGKPGETQERLFVNSFLSSYDWQIDGEGEDARIIPLNKADGKPLLDDHQRRIDFTDLVKTRTEETFPLQAAESKSAPDATGKKGTGAAAPAKKIYPTLQLKPTATEQDYILGIQKIRESALTAEEKSKASIEFTADYETLAAGGTVK